MKRRWPEIANCYACKAEIVFDNEHIGKNGKKIPLDPFTKNPHDCPMREKPNPIMSTWGSGGQEKNDHGNEESSPWLREVKSVEDPPVQKYVDHTQQAKGQSKVKIFYSNAPSDVEELYNEFLVVNKVKTQGAQFQMCEDATGRMFAIALYYEEVTA